MKHYKALVIISGIILTALTACKSMQKHEYRYTTDDQSIPAAEIPAGLDAWTRESLYPVPSVIQEGDSTAPYITPPGSVINPYQW